MNVGERHNAVIFKAIKLNVSDNSDWYTFFTLLQIITNSIWRVNLIENYYCFVMILSQ